MINIIPVQKAYKTKIARQEKLKGLKFQSHGSCAYIGEDVSPGCYACFHSDAFSYGFMLGRDMGLPDVCNKDCVYCFEPHGVSHDYKIPADWKLSDKWKDDFRRDLDKQKLLIGDDCKMQYYEFTGVCEPLFYLPVIETIMDFMRIVVDPFMGTRGWAKIYTNGTLLNAKRLSVLKDLGMDEIRIHPAASNFSEQVYGNASAAVKRIPTITIETPSWPLHRDKLFEMLPLIQKIGIKHLDICQVEITGNRQLRRIEEALGSIDIYHAFYPVLDDSGLVEELMGEVLKQKYSYSVIDCNGFVKQSRSALTSRSFWNILNRKYPEKWRLHRLGRKIS